MMESDGMQARVAKLEAKLRLTTGISFGLMILVALGLTLGFRSGSDNTTQPMPANVVEAREFVLKDKDGKKRAWLGITPENFAALILFDGKDRLRSSLFAGPADSDPVGIETYDASNQRLTFCGIDRGGEAKIRLRGKVPSLEIFDNDGKSRAEFALQERPGAKGAEPVLGMHSVTKSKFLVIRMVNDSPKIILADDVRHRDIRLGIEGDSDGYLQFSDDNTARIFLGMDSKSKLPVLSFFRSVDVPGYSGNEKANMQLRLDGQDQQPLFLVNGSSVLP